MLSATLSKQLIAFGLAFVLAATSFTATSSGFFDTQIKDSSLDSLIPSFETNQQVTPSSFQSDDKDAGLIDDELLDTQDAFSEAAEGAPTQTPLDVLPVWLENEVSELNESDTSKTILGVDTLANDSLSSVTFINDDGSRTAVDYATDIKFVDEDGQVQYKDTSLIALEASDPLFPDYAYTNASGLTKSYLPKDIQTGVLMNTGAFTLFMRPLFDFEAVQQEQNDESVADEEKASSDDEATDTEENASTSDEEALESDDEKNSLSDDDSSEAFDTDAAVKGSEQEAFNDEDAGETAGSTDTTDEAANTSDEASDTEQDTSDTSKPQRTPTQSLPHVDGADTVALTTTFDGKQAAEYKHAFGAGTALQYGGILDGIKENIVLEHYTGQSEFCFLVNTGGLTPAEEYGQSIDLLDENGNVAATLSDIFMRDSYTGDDECDFHDSFCCSLMMEATDTPGEYLLTLFVDEEFLTDPTTVYPVIIDPSVSAAASFVKSTSVFSKEASKNHYSSDYNFVGKSYKYTTTKKVNGKNKKATVDMGQAQIYVNFSGIANYKYINPDKITAAYYRVYQASGAKAAINCYPAKKEWTYSKITWNNRPALAGKQSSQTFSSSVYNAIPITTSFKSWLKKALGEGGYAQSRGFVLTSSAASALKLASSKNTSKPPSIVISYNPDMSVYGTAKGSAYYLIKNKKANKDKKDYLGINNKGTVGMQKLTEYPNQIWKVTHLGNGFYTLENQRYVVFGSKNFLYCSKNADKGSVTSDPRFTQLYRLVKNKGGGYRIMPIISASRSLKTGKSGKPAYANKSAAEVKKYYVYALLHEESHHLGAHDHYCYGKKGNKPCSNKYCYTCTKRLDPPMCIMSGTWGDYTTRARGAIFCDDCINIISKHIADHHKVK
ncbi:MAG: hypothetical protein LBB42_01550 [Coriobacteriales bacterium]|jgi:hypothetical protein|nr:hypothetical protein [Coriobacteriales bacterium]